VGLGECQGAFAGGYEDMGRVRHGK
jgi:hypothetical protein